MDAPKKNPAPAALIPKSLRLKALGYHWMFIFSIALIVLSVWELTVRLDAMKTPLDMFFRLAEGEGIPLTRVLQYFEWDMLEPLFWLVLCILIGLINLFTCRRPIGSMLMLPFCTALAVYGLMREGSALSEFSFPIQPVLLLAVVVFGIINLSTYRVRQNRLMCNILRAGELLRSQEAVEFPTCAADAPSQESMLPSTDNMAKVYLRQETPQPSRAYEDDDRPTYPPPRLKA